MLNAFTWYANYNSTVNTKGGLSKSVILRKFINIYLNIFLENTALLSYRGPDKWIIILLLIIEEE